MSDQARAYLYAGATVLFWSTVASAFKLSLRHLDHLQLLLYAALTSLSVLFVILLVQGKLGLVTACSGGDWRRSALLGFLNPFLYYVVLFKAYTLLPAQEAQPLNYTWPIALAILSVPLLGQRLGRRSLAAIVVSFAGVVVISTHGNPLSLRLGDPLGVGLALGSSVIWALFWIGNVRDRRDEVVKLFMVFLFGFAFILALMLLLGRPLAVDPRGLAGAVYVGLFEMGITFVTWLKALRYARRAVQVGNLVYLAPFLSLLFIRFIVGERILVSTVAGLALIVAGIVLQSTPRRETRGNIREGC